MIGGADRTVREGKRVGAKGRQTRLYGLLPRRSGDIV